MTNRTHLVSLAAIAALSLFNGAARADDGGGGSSYDFPAVLAADSGLGYESDTPITCAEANRNAWFLRQMAITDGDVDPTVAPVECRPAGEIASNSSEGE